MKILLRLQKLKFMDGRFIRLGLTQCASFGDISFLLSRPLGINLFDMTRSGIFIFT